MTSLKRNRDSRGILLLLVLALTLILAPSLSQASGDRAGEKNEITDYRCQRVFLLNLKGSINPGSAELLARAIRDAESHPPSCLLVILDTPGGLVSSLREMVQKVMSARVPVIVYVAPSGAQAASAGAILTMAAHIAAMAPGTNIGAAHPVGIGPDKEEGETMARKAENDLAAMARAIASERGRNPKWAEDAVRSSVSASAREALALNVIDCLARDKEELLERLNGKEVRLSSGMVRLVINRYEIIRIHETARERLLRTIADPNIAYMLLMLGMAGLYFEFAHPGAVLPGTLGALCLLLGLYAMQALPVTTTGLLLLLLAVILFVLEIVVTSYGILGAGGLISLIIGSLMLYDTSATGISLAASVLYPTVISMGLFLSVIAYLATRATLSRPKSGMEALKGQRGFVKREVGPEGGQVFLDGELWTAYSDASIPEGTEIVVIEVEGLRLKVAPSK